MSRKMIDDHVQVKRYTAPSADPDDADSSYDAGHTLLNAEVGTVYTNVGTRSASIWGNFPANRYELVETFQRAPLINGDVGVAANLDFEVLTNSTNSITSSVTTFADGGGVTVTTLTASADNVIITPHLDTKQSAWATAKWNTSDRVVFETTIKTGSSIASTTIWAGLKLTNTAVVATDNDQVFVRYEAGVASGVFQLITSASGTDTTTNTSVTVAVSTSYHIVIKVDSDRRARLYINGALAATSSAALTANVDLKAYIGVQTATGAKTLTVRGLKLSKDLND